jgi:molybdopterin-biosynthesis enzyme MoeA-like protein
MMVDNVYPLPGIPELFRRKFLELKELWPTAAPRWRRCLNLVAMETDLAELLGTVAAQHPNVQLGSYPTCKAGTWHLELVLESSDRDQLELALAVLVEALGVEPAPH